MRPKNTKLKTVNRAALIALLILFLTGACSPAPDEPVPDNKAGPEVAENPVRNLVGIDPDSGLLIDKHWQLVKANCSACHSARLVTQNRGNRQTWLEMIRWMQETQGLWPLDADTEKGILDYLEKNYAPDSVHRRAPLPQTQMPDNPYAGNDKQAPE